MQCPVKSSEGVEVFMGYGARILPPGTEAALERHMLTCDDCRRMADAQRSVWSALDAWEPLPVSPDFNEKLYARLAAESRRPWYRSAFHGLFNSGWFNFHGTWSFRPAMPVGAACATLIAAFLLRGPVPDRKPDFSAQQNRVDLEQVERALDDIDMLKQLGVVPPPAKQTAGKKL